MLAARFESDPQIRDRLMLCRKDLDQQVQSRRWNAYATAVTARSTRNAMNDMDTGLVCASALGTPLDHANVLRHFGAICARAGVPKIRVYDLRHSAVSPMLDADGDLKAVSEVVGHSNPGITMRVYRHVRPAQSTAAIPGLADALDGPAGGI